MLDQPEWSIEAYSVLCTLQGEGVRLNRDADTLLAAPRCRITPELEAMIRRTKPHLLTLLSDAERLRTTEPAHVLESTARYHADRLFATEQKGECLVDPDYRRTLAFYCTLLTAITMED